jgi:hypothetical protein
MSIIDISDVLYARLARHAVNFEQPEQVIEKVLNVYEEAMNKKEPVIVNPDNLDKQQISELHDELFQFLFDRHLQNRDFVFMPRQQASERLSQGYWFLGDDNYLIISFYSGGDVNQTPNIMFQMFLSDVHPKNKRINRSNSPLPLSSIQLANTAGYAGWETKEPVINEIRKRLGGFECNRISNGIESRWNRYYEGTDYLKCLEEFLIKDKPIIDEIIREAKNSEIGFLDKNKARNKMNAIERMRTASRMQ